MFVSSVIAMLITPLRVVPELTDWKSDVLVDTRGVRSSSIDGYI